MDGRPKCERWNNKLSRDGTILYFLDLRRGGCRASWVLDTFYTSICVGTTSCVQCVNTLEFYTAAICSFLNVCQTYLLLCYLTYFIWYICFYFLLLKFNKRVILPAFLGTVSWKDAVFKLYIFKCYLFL